MQSRVYVTVEFVSGIRYMNDFFFQNEAKTVLAEYLLYIAA